MNDCFNLIRSNDVLDVLDGKKDSSQLMDEKLRLLYRLCNTDEERRQALLDIENLFAVFSPFIASLTYEEYDALNRYGRKIGSNSYEINEALRTNALLSEENRSAIENLDRAISKFHLPEEVKVYRALTNPDIKFSDEGYMSTSLSLYESYATFDGYDDVLEITLPAGTSCVYLEWFKGAADESEMLLARGTSLDLENARTEMICGNTKRVYSCRAVQSSYKNEATIH